MIRFVFILISSLNLFPGSVLNGIAPSRSESFSGCTQDTLQSKQILYNGRVWRNLYINIRGDQFLFSSDFLPGTVTINGKTYNNMNIKYDIYNDEMLTVTDRRIILQLNKEMVEMFTIDFDNKTYLFQKMESEGKNTLTGYVNILKNGDFSLVVKYKKEIDLLAVENKYDIFNQSNRIYIRKEGVLYPIYFRKDFLNLLSDYKQQVRDFIKVRKIHITKRNPGSFIPVIEFYDNLRH